MTCLVIDSARRVLEVHQTDFHDYLFENTHFWNEDDLETKEFQ